LLFWSNLAVIEGNLEVATKPDESLSPSLSLSQVRWPDARQSKGLRPIKPTSVLRRHSILLPRETTIDITKLSRSRLIPYRCIFLSNKALFQRSRAHLFTAVLRKNSV
jgi:hypothetical protein